MQKLPVGIENAGNTCFAGALLQCLATVAIPSTAIAKSLDALDKLVVGVRNGPTRHGHAAMQLQTCLIREIYDADVGHQGQQCPMQFFAASCRKEGVLAESFNAEISEVLKCGTCNKSLSVPQHSSDNHIHMLKYDSSTRASTLTDLILENIVSGRIEGYTPSAHATGPSKDRASPATQCENTDGAFHVRYFSAALPQHLCFALASITGNTSLKNTRSFHPQHSMLLPELNAASPPNSHDTQNVEYYLLGTVVHSGSSAETGHFAAYVLRGGVWFFIDDEHARPVLPHVVTRPPPHQTIYMLFYRRAQRVC